MLNHRHAATALLVSLLAIAGCASGPPPVPERLDGVDLATMQTTIQAALESGRLGQSANWENPANGHRGTVTPIRTVESTGEAPCRDYQLTATVEAATVIGYDTACRRADGVWVSRRFDDPADALRYSTRQRASSYNDPYYNDPFCNGSRRPYDPWCQPRSGVSIGVGTRF
jgi:surface antigen